MMQINTDDDWLNEIRLRLGRIPRLAALTSQVSTGGNALQRDGLSLGNCARHCEVIADALIRLYEQKVFDDDMVIRALTDLVRPNTTYGQFFELSAYDWMLRSNVQLEVQVALGAADIVNPNGCSVDGRAVHAGLYFDVKSLGLHEYVVRKLIDKLEKGLPGRSIRTSKG